MCGCLRILGRKEAHALRRQPVEGGWSSKWGQLMNCSHSAAPHPAPAPAASGVCTHLLQQVESLGRQPGRRSEPWGPADASHSGWPFGRRPQPLPQGGTEGGRGPSAGFIHMESHPQLKGFRKMSLWDHN